MPIIQATLQTKLACGALVTIIINICLLIAIITFVSKIEIMCSLDLAVTDLPHEKLSYQSEDEFRTNIITHPWMVAFLILPEHIFVSSASIITKSWTITTAYSVEKVANYSLSKKGFRGGSTSWNKGGYYHFAVKIIPHEKFDPYTLDYNIALIAVSYPFSNPNEIPISIAGSRFKVAENKLAEVVGWAVLNDTSRMSEFLLHSKVSLIPYTLCKSTLDKIKKDNSTKRSLCTKTKLNDQHANSCMFTSGSALVTNSTLIGLASWGVSCNEDDWPGVYLYLKTVLPWIKNIKNQEDIPLTLI